jgi:hypothetical protein
LGVDLNHFTCDSFRKRNSEKETQLRCARCRK